MDLVLAALDAANLSVDPGSLTEFKESKVGVRDKRERKSKVRKRRVGGRILVAICEPAW